MFFRLANPVLVIVVTVVVAGTTAAGIALGRKLKSSHDEIREPIGAVQAALLAASEGAATRLYVESLNTMFDAGTSPLADGCSPPFSRRRW